MGLFPAYIENDISVRQEQKRKIPREYGVDFRTGQLTGEVVEGGEAIKVWIWFALRTPRYRFYAYSWDYGSEFEDLIGQGYSKEYIETETRRMTEDCLLINEDIQSISDFSATMEGSALTVSFTANTLYGGITFLNEKVILVEGGAGNVV